MCPVEAIGLDGGIVFRRRDNEWKSLRATCRTPNLEFTTTWRPSTRAEGRSPSIVSRQFDEQRVERAGDRRFATAERGR